MPSIHRTRNLSLLAAAALFGCSAKATDPSCLEADTGALPRGTVPIKVETVVSGLSVPWGIAFLPGGDWLVTERPGRIRLLSGGTLVPAPVAIVDIASNGEGGLLGIALHPDFANNSLFYVYATVDVGGEPTNRVIRYKLSTDHLTAAVDQIILDGIPGAQFHDGGRIRFGPDGMLYVGTGDGRVPDRSQSMSERNGKLLRLTPDGAIPTDNPFPGSPVFLLGIRNTQGFDWFDAQTLVVTDHGPSGDTDRTGHDEVNVVHAGDNLGWPDIAGCEASSGKIAPVLTFTEAVPPGGAALYTGDAIPEWKGSLIVGTLRSEHLHRVAFDPQNHRRMTLHEVYLEGEPPAGKGRLREVVMGPDGALYVTTSNCDGRGICPPDQDRILRITR